MRVLVVSSLYPGAGDPTRGIFVHEQVKALRATGIDARVLSGDVLWLDPTRPVASARAWQRHRGAAAPDFEAWDGVPVARFRYVVPRGLWARVGADRYRDAAAGAARALRHAHPFALVHAHTALLDGWAGLGLAREHGVPLVLTEHSGPFRTLTATDATRRRTAAAVGGADRGIAVSRALWQAIRGDVPVPRPERWRVIPNGVDAAAFGRAGAGEAPPDDGRVHAVWIGHLVPVKRPLVLLQAFARARREAPHLRLAMVGSGPLEAAARARAAALGLGDAVAWHALASREAVARHLARSHFLVLASELETFGVVAIEALAAGRPVLATRCGGPEEIVDEPRLGALVDLDEGALARGLVAMARRPWPLPPAEADWIRACARERWDYARIAHRIAAVYGELGLAPPAAVTRA